jgi:hypothetical protein
LEENDAFIFRAEERAMYETSMKQAASKILADFHWTTWHYIPENRALQSFTCYGVVLLMG